VEKYHNPFAAERESIFHIIFNNIVVMLWQSVILAEETGFAAE
jgi:hypothetical protein